MSRKSELEERFLVFVRANELPEPEREYRFHPERRWRFDFAWPERKLAVEMEGGGGRHHTFSGSHNDADKYNSAVCLGWRVLRFTGWHLRTSKTTDAERARWDMLDTLMRAMGFEDKTNRERSNA